MRKKFSPGKEHFAAQKCAPICFFCGSSLSKKMSRQTLERGPLRMQTNPISFSWNDEQIYLTALEGNLMALIMIEGAAAPEQLESIFGEDQSSMRVVIHRIRTKFRKVGANDLIKTIRGAGLRLNI